MASASYTGINKIRRATYTVGHDGVGIATLDIVPQASLSFASGTLTLSDGTNSVSVSGCKIDRSKIVVGMNGHVEQVTILDPTWKWQFGTLYGTYNVRRPDGTVDPATEKTPRQLATLAFAAMGVGSPDVSAMPNDDRPFVQWMCTNARSALRWLCYRAGCSFGRKVVGGGAAVWSLGTGDPLPADGDVQSVDYGVDVGELPDNIEIVCGPTRFQAKIKLEPVGIDEDGSIKHVKDLAYNPGGVGVADGWDGADPEHPLPPDADELHQYLAKRSIWRMWRVVTFADGTLEVPGYDEVDSIERILPLRDDLAEGYTNGDSATYRQMAYIEGARAIPGEPASLENTEDFTRIDVGFRIDKEAGILFSDTPLFKYDANLIVTAADVYLVTSFHVRDADTGEYYRYGWTEAIASNGTGALGVGRPDLEERIIAEYENGSDPAEVTGTNNNDTDLDAELEDQATAMLAEYQTVQSHVVRYRNIKEIVLDGAIREVTWIVDCGSRNRDGGVWTLASRNTESSWGIPQRRERKRVAQTDRTTAVREIEEHERHRMVRRGLA